MKTCTSRKQRANDQYRECIRLRWLTVTAGPLPLLVDGVQPILRPPIALKHHNLLFYFLGTREAPKQGAARARRTGGRAECARAGRGVAELERLDLDRSSRARGQLLLEEITAAATETARSRRGGAKRGCGGASGSGLAKLRKAAEACVVIQISEFFSLCLVDCSTLRTHEGKTSEQVA